MNRFNSFNNVICFLFLSGVLGACIRYDSDPDFMSFLLDLIQYPSHLAWELWVKPFVKHWISLLKMRKIAGNMKGDTWKTGRIFINYLKTAGERSWKAFDASSFWKLLWFLAGFPCVLHVIILSSFSVLDIF